MESTTDPPPSDVDAADLPVVEETTIMGATVTTGTTAGTTGTDATITATTASNTTTTATTATHDDLHLHPHHHSEHSESSHQWGEAMGGDSNVHNHNNHTFWQAVATTTTTAPPPPSEEAYFASTASVFLTESTPPPVETGAGGGSITRFASEAAQAVGVTLPLSSSSSSPVLVANHHTTATATATTTTYVSPFAKPVPPPPMTFAERSQQAYMKSGGTTTTTISSSSSTLSPAAATAQAPRVMYGARMPPSHQQHNNNNSWTSPPPQAHAQVPISQPPTSSQISPSHYNTNNNNVPPPPATRRLPAPAPAAGSYAARSQMYSSGTTTSTATTAAVSMPATASYHQQQQQQQPNPQSYYNSSSGSVMSPPNPNMTTAAAAMSHSSAAAAAAAASASSLALLGSESTQFQQKILTDSIRKVQEHAYYMKQAMEQKNLAVTMDRAAHMVGELGGPPHGHATTNASSQQSSSSSNNSSGAPTNTGVSAKLTPKNYYDLYMRALEDMPLFEEYLYNLVVSSSSSVVVVPPDQQPTGMIQIVAEASTAASLTTTTTTYTMKQLYDCVQYCPRVVSRLYLQIAAGSALIRSGECSAKYVMADLQDAVRCEQNPVRGLFLRYFLITALRDKLPDVPPPTPTLPPPIMDATTTDNHPDSDAIVNDNVPAATASDKYLEESETAADMKEEGTVKDSYEFILANFMEMNKLWVRIQHLPGEGKDKEARKRRERERNDLRILVGTNLVRLSQLECVTSKIYGEEILPYILEHIVTTGDPLSQAYLMDCLVQVFPDEYHIETLPILLNVCPRLKDKVNIRTILQGLMDRLAKYLADEELLDESDTNQVKISLAKDSFGLFEECVQKVYNARGPKLTSKEVIRLQTALLQYSIKCFPGHVVQVGRCIDSCVTALQQANASYDPTTASNSNTAIGAASLDDTSVAELEKLLSIPLDSLALKVLEFDTYSQLIGFLPWQNRRALAIAMLTALENSGSTPKHIKDIEQLFHVIEPLLRDETSMNYPQIPPHMMTASGMMSQPARMDPNRHTKVSEENGHVAKLLHTFNHSDIDIMYNMLLVAKRHLTHELSGPDRTVHTLSALVYAAFRLANCIFASERNSTADATDVPSDNHTAADGDTIEPTNPVSNGDNDTKQDDGKDATTKTEKPISSRLVFVLIQETIELIARNDAEKGVKLYVEASALADRNVSAKVLDHDGTDMTIISYELLRLAMTIYEDRVTDPKCQCRCITSFTGTILALKSVSRENYESLITRTAQFAAKITLKPEQCQLVALCAHLFYPADNGGQSKYSNPQRALECLQRSLKLADACTTANPACITLFVDLLEHYVYFFEKKNPLITHAYITGLIALINEHLNSLNAIGSDKEAKAHFVEVLCYIKKKKMNASDVSEMFSQIQIS